LEWVLAGEPIQPVADIDTDLPSDPLQRIGPLTVAVDASYSYTVGSQITQVELDYDGDGTYDDSGLDLNFTHIYDPGDYTARLRITDSRGQSSTDEQSFHVINPANQLPTASFTPIIVTNNAPLTVNFDASMSSDPDGSITTYDWDFDNDGDIDYTSAAPEATYTFCAEGANDVRLRVTDNDLATDEQYGQVICNNGWRRKVVATGISNVGDQISATVQGSGVNARACVAFCSSSNGSLYFVRGNSSNGLGWDAQVKVLNGDVDYTYGSPSIAIEQMTQTQCIAYGVYGPTDPETGLFFIRSNNSMGSAWGVPVAVDTGIAAGDRNCLQQPGGKLTIANIAKASYQGGSALRVFQATDALGATWGPATTLDSSEPNEQITRVAMFSASGVNPIIAWTSRLDSASSYQSCTATTLNGTAWAAAVSIPSGAGQNSDDLGLGLAGGFPALCFGSTSSGSALWYARADDAAAGAWSTVPAKIDNPGWTGGFCTMATVAGVPAIAYYEVSPQARVMYIQAADANGTSWNTPQIVDSSGNVGNRLTMCVLPSNLPLIVYFDSSNQQVKSAVLF
jgi:PKD repeat protein